MEDQGKRDQDREELWRKIGAIHSEADPEGIIAKHLGKSPEDRLAAIWDIVQTLRP